MKPTRSIAGNTAFDSATQVLMIASSLIAGIFLARILGDEGRGQYVLATSFASMVLYAFVNLGVELAASVLVAKEPERASRVHSVVLVSSILVGVFLLLLLWAARMLYTDYLFPGIDTWSLAVLLLTFPIWMYKSGCFGILVGLGRIRARAIVDLAGNLAINILSIAILLLMQNAPEDETIRTLVFTFYAGNAVAGIYTGIVLAKRRRLWAVPDWATVRDLYQYGFWVYVGNMGANLGQRIDQYFVQQVSASSGAFGIYTLATSLTQRTRLFPQALSRASYARICSAEEPEAARLVAACFRQMLVLGIVLAAVGAMASPLIPIIYTKDFAPAVTPFIIFLVGQVFGNCSWMLANYFTGHLAQPRIPMIINWVLLPIQGVAAYFAMSMGGLTAVALITSISYFFTFAVFVVLFLRMQRHVSAWELFAIRGEDLAHWRPLVRKLLRR